MEPPPPPLDHSVPLLTHICYSPKQSKSGAQKLLFRRLTANVVARFSPNRTGNGVAAEFALMKLIEKKKTVVMSQKMTFQLIAACND